MKKVWDKVKKITGRNCGQMSHHLKNKNGELITSKKDIADTLGEQFQQCSSSANYTPEFQRIKSKKESNPINFKTDKELKYLFGMTRRFI